MERTLKENSLMFIVMVGQFFSEPVTFHGPFYSHESAVTWADKNANNWVILPMQEPE